MSVKSKGRAAATALGWGTHHGMHWAAQLWHTHSPAVRTTGEGHSPNPAPAHSSAWGNKGLTLGESYKKKIHSFRMRKKPFCILFLAGFAQAVEEHSSLLYTHECLARPWASKIIRPSKDSYYSKSWVAEHITCGWYCHRAQAGRVNRKLQVSLVPRLHLLPLHSLLHGKSLSINPSIWFWWMVLWLHRSSKYLWVSLSLQWQIKTHYLPFSSALTSPVLTGYWWKKYSNKI